jgi:hypothetical protein
MTGGEDRAAVLRGAPSPRTSGATPSIEQRHGARPAAGRGFDLGREASDNEAIGRQLIEVAQLLHVAIGNLPAGFVAFPDDRGIVRRFPALARVHEGRVPAPGVDAADAHTARRKIER